MTPITVIGAGLAGCEAAYQIAKRGHDVLLIESKPKQSTPAHSSKLFAELVCSNSLKSDDMLTASGLLKQELRMMGSLLLQAADACAVPAGNALAVDRQRFAIAVTDAIRTNKHIRVLEQTAADWDAEKITVLATGPLTLSPLSDTMARVLGGHLHFYDAAAPIVSAESLDWSQTVSASRYGKGGDDYVNCFLGKEQYETFWQALVSAETVQLHDFEKAEVFEGCMPVEIMARRGLDTLRFGPLKPVGFTDPATGKRPYAVVQLRAENRERTMFNLVGFQTNLKFGEQKRVFGLIPALQHAEFLRYGVMHRNSFINAPKTLGVGFCVKESGKTFIAGQLSGVEGYVESMGSGLWAGLNAARMAEGAAPLTPPETTVMGALMRYLTAPNDNFQPMNANFGILPPLSEPVRDKQKRKEALVQRALTQLKDFQIANHLN